MIKQTKTRYSDVFAYYENDSIIGKSIETYGEYSQLEIDFILSFLTKDSIVYDIGANIGYHTTAFASKAAHVYAFEPHPKTFELLVKNTDKMSNISLLNYAISNFDGPAKCMDYSLDNVENYGAVSVNNKQGTVDITCATLNDKDIPWPDFIKIDVEGSELAVIQGCFDIIKAKQPVIYYEAHETVELREIYNLLSELDYRLYWCKVNNYNTNNFNKNYLNIFGDTSLHNVLVWPLYLPELPLDQVQGPDDTLEKLYAAKGFTYIKH